MMFLSLSEYEARGGMLQRHEFFQEESKAEAFINLLTHDRVKTEDPARDAVKNAVFDLIALQVMAASAEQIAVSGISEKTNDGISVKYYDAEDLQRQIQDARKRCVFQWLAGETVALRVNNTIYTVPLLYAGVEHDGGEHV